MWRVIREWRRHMFRLAWRRHPLARIDLVIFEKLRVQLLVMFGHLIWLFKEGFGGHGKEFGRIGGTVMVHHALLLINGVMAQVGKIARQHGGPATVARDIQIGRASCRERV